MLFVGRSALCLVQSEHDSSRSSTCSRPGLGGTTIKSAISTIEVPEGRCSKRIVEHWLFKHGITAVVILGIIQVGVATDFNDPGYQRVWNVWEGFYTVVSAIEAVIMIHAYRYVYFAVPHTVLDFVLALSSVLDVCIFPLFGMNPDLSPLRLIRLLRILRIIKFTKLFPGFSTIIGGLLDSFRSMLYIFALLFVILYAASICCVSVLGGSNAGYPDYDAGNVQADQLDGFNNFHYFGTLFRSMLTLLGMLLLSEWALIRPIAEVHPGMVLFFLCMLVVVTFGVVNVMVGVVVDRTMNAMNQPRMDHIQKEVEAKAATTESLAEVFVQIDQDADGRASLAELAGCLSKPEFVDKLELLDLPDGFTLVEFLRMLDVDGSGMLTKMEFVTGLYRLIYCSDWQRNCLHAMSLGMVHHSVTEMWKELQTEVRDCKASIVAMQLDIRMALGSNMAASRMAQVTSFTESASVPVLDDAQNFQWEPLPQGNCTPCGKPLRLSPTLRASATTDAVDYLSRTVPSPSNMTVCKDLGSCDCHTRARHDHAKNDLGHEQHVDLTLLNHALPPPPPPPPPLLDGALLSQLPPLPPPPPI